MERHKIYKIRKWPLLVLLLVGVPTMAFSQKVRSVDGTINFIDDKNDGLGCAQLTYTWWLNRYVGVSTGGMFVKSKYSSYWKGNDKEYFLDNNIFKLNAVEELKVAIPVVQRLGVFAEAQFFFGPIPWDYISLEIHRDGEVWHKSKYLFTKFNPGGMLNGGVFYDFGEGNRRVRVAAGLGKGYYDVYSSHRHATIDAQNLSTHVPVNHQPITSYFIKLSVFK